VKHIQNIHAPFRVHHFRALCNAEVSYAENEGPLCDYCSALRKSHSVFQRWLDTEPEWVQKSAKQYPPGWYLQGERRVYVMLIGYGHEGKAWGSPNEGMVFDQILCGDPRAVKLDDQLTPVGAAAVPHQLLERFERFLERGLTSRRKA
jgi:hypothetical protein